MNVEALIWYVAVAPINVPSYRPKPFPFSPRRYLFLIWIFGFDKAWIWLLKPDTGPWLIVIPHGCM